VANVTSVGQCNQKTKHTVCESGSIHTYELFFYASSQSLMIPTFSEDEVTQISISHKITETLIDVGLVDNDVAGGDFVGYHK